MGRLPTENRQYQLQGLNNTHHEILRLALLGMRPKTIARTLGVTPETVNNAVNGARGRQQLALLRGARDSSTIDIARDIRDFAPRALEIMKELAEDENQAGTTRLKAATELLGIAGHVKPQRVQVQGAVAHLTVSEIDEIKKRARELAIASGTIDAEYVELPAPSTESIQGRLSLDTSTDLDRREDQNAGQTVTTAVLS